MDGMAKRADDVLLLVGEVGRRGEREGLGETRKDGVR